MLSSEWDWITKKEYPIAAKAIQNNFYMDDFIKSVETPEESIEVFNQLQPLPSRHGFELKKWISNEDAVTEAIPEDLKSISNTDPVRRDLQCYDYNGPLLMIAFKCVEVPTRKWKPL